MRKPRLRDRTSLVRSSWRTKGGEIQTELLIPDTSLWLSPGPHTPPPPAYMSAPQEVPKLQALGGRQASPCFSPSLLGLCGYPWTTSTSSHWRKGVGRGWGGPSPRGAHSTAWHWADRAGEALLTEQLWRLEKRSRPRYVSAAPPSGDTALLPTPGPVLSLTLYIRGTFSEQLPCAKD